MFKKLSLQAAALCAVGLLATAGAADDAGVEVDPTITSAINPDGSVEVATHAGANRTSTHLVLAEIINPDPGHESNLALRSAVERGAIAGVFFSDQSIGNRDEFEGLADLFRKPSSAGEPVMALRLSRSAAEGLVDLYVPRAEQTLADLPQIMFKLGFTLDLAVPVDWDRLRAPTAGMEAGVVMLARNAISIRESYDIGSAIALPTALIDASPDASESGGTIRAMSHVVDALADRTLAAVVVAGPDTFPAARAFLSAGIAYGGVVAFAVDCAAVKSGVPGNAPAAIAADSMVLAEGEDCSLTGTLDALVQRLATNAIVADGAGNRLARFAGVPRRDARSPVSADRAVSTTPEIR